MGNMNGGSININDNRYNGHTTTTPKMDRTFKPKFNWFIS